MNTSSEAIHQLQQAQAAAQAALRVIDNLIAAHDYQDTASLVTQAAAALLESAVQMMQSRAVEAVEALEAAEDLLDSVWDIIDAETDED